jgi:hypothetical protein
MFLAQQKADRIYQYFFELAKTNGYDDKTSHFLALNPAKYVYDTIMTKGCVNSQCCMKYCFDSLDSEFNNLPDTFIEEIWKSDNGGICPTKPIATIRSEYNIIRNNLKKKVVPNAVDLLSRQMEGINIGINLDDIFKNLNI